MPFPLENDIDGFVKSRLQDHPTRLCSRPKVVHDPILVTNLFDECEVSLVLLGNG